MSDFDLAKLSKTLLEWQDEVEAASSDHYDCERHFSNLDNTLLLLSAGASVLVGGSLISDIAQINTTARVLTGLFSLTAAGLIAIQRAVKYSERAERHRITAAKYLNLLDEIKQLLALIPTGSLLEPNRIDKIRYAKAEITKEAPGIPNRIYWHKPSRRQLDVEGITVFHPNRDRIPPLEHSFNQAKKEIILYAVQHSAVVHQYLGLLRDKAQKGCQVKILMMAPRMPNGEVNPNVRESESQRRYVGLLPQIENNTRTIQEWWGSLSESAKQMVEVRAYQEYPVATYTFIDRNEANGYVLVEIQHYGIHVHDMPHYIVNKKDRSSAQFFQIHCESFDRLWSKSYALHPVAYST